LIRATSQFIAHPHHYRFSQVPDSSMEHPITVVSPSKEGSEPKQLDKIEMEGQTDVSVSGMESQRDTGSDERIHVSASMQGNDHTEEIDGVNFDKDQQNEETDDKEDTEVDKVATELQADKLLTWQRKITFPQHPETVQDDENERNDAPLTMSKDDDNDNSEPSEDKEDLLILPDPVVVRSHDFSPRSVQEFLLNYPDNRENLHSMINLRFFNNEIRFQPNGTFIDDFHKFAFGKFKLLEQHHGYPLLTIVWLTVDIFSGFFQLESKD
jgi:hypothetical protein